MSQLINDKQMLEYDLFKSYSNICCFTTTRHGGCSTGTYGTFNCTDYCGDNAADVLKNKQLLITRLQLPSVELVLPRQTHQSVIRVIDKSYGVLSADQQREFLSGVDALVTDLANYCLCVSTADCVPILLYDVVHQAIGVVHAGWRGTVNKLLTDTLSVMQSQYGTTPDSLRACIGPSISLASFEVGDEVYTAFDEAQFPMSKVSWRNMETNKWHIDLWEANRWQLLQWGVGEACIEIASICTYKENEDFFSARQLGIASGRILSGIVLHAKN